MYAPTKVSSLLQVCYLRAWSRAAVPGCPALGRYFCCFRFLGRTLKLVVFADLLQAESMIFPANKTCPVDLTKIRCIDLIRLIYWFGFLSFSFLTSIEFNLLMYLFWPWFCWRLCTWAQFKISCSAYAFLVSRSHWPDSAKAIAGIGDNVGPEPSRAGTDNQLINTKACANPPNYSLACTAQMQRCYLPLLMTHRREQSPAPSLIARCFCTNNSNQH